MNVRILTLFDEEPPVPKKAPVEKRKPVSVKDKKSIEEEVNLEKKKNPSKTVSKPIVDSEQSSDKNYYTIGETATKFKVRTSHIRFWTVQFGMKVRTTRKGDRLYTPENIEQLRVIHHLVKEQGYTIAGAKIKLKELKNVNLVDLQKNTVIGSLKALRETLIALRNQV